MKAALILLGLATVLAACSQQKDASGSSGPVTTKPVDIHTSQNSLDWAGTYEGVLPCADCPGTESRLTLNHDGSYQLVTRSQGRQDAAKTVSGSFTWQADGNAIALDERGDGQQYSVGEGRLTLLRHEGGTAASPEANLVLTLVAPTAKSDDLAQQLESYRWTLASAADAQNRHIAGLPPSKDHPVVLNFSGSRLSIQGPCNRIAGGYQINAQRQLVVNGTASTMMSCADAGRYCSVQRAGPTAAGRDDWSPGPAATANIGCEWDADVHRPGYSGIALRSWHHGLSRDLSPLGCLPKSAVPKHSLSPVPRAALRRKRLGDWNARRMAAAARKY